jgi:GT2 family glycosyltransferase
MFVVTATLNGVEYTQRLLASIGNVANEAIHLVVIDQGSTDGTSEWLGSLQYPDLGGKAGPPMTAHGLTLIPNERNTGAATAWNLGIRIALQNGADKILVVGNDTMPQPGTVERLSALLNEGIQFVTGTAVPYDKPDTLMALPLPHDGCGNSGAIRRGVRGDGARTDGWAETAYPLQAVGLGIDG